MTSRPPRRINHGMSDDAPIRCHFDARLMPHRSLSRRGFHLLMASVTVAFALVGLSFWSLGAWPVAGFCGLEVLLIWGAFELNYRSGKAHETVRLDQENLVVTHVDAGGRATVWRFEPSWVRVSLDRPGEEDSTLSLASHGRRLVIGAFLTPKERTEVADALGDALRRWRNALAPL